MKLIFLLLLPVTVIGQGVYLGTVINKETKQGIPFATLGLTRRNTGTNADENGQFTFNTWPSKSDTFIISSVGYETLKLPVDKVLPNLIIELQPSEAKLKEVIVVNNYQWKSETPGKYSNCGTNYYTTGNTINQVAQHFKATKANTLLNEIDICKYSIAIIDPARTKFRLRIYCMNMLTNAPSNDLCDCIIELDVTGRHVRVNLEKYHITIPDKDFFVAIEWLRIPLNEERNKGKLNGQKINHITYNPLIAFKEDLSKDDDLQSWQLDYRGRWMPFRLKGKNIILMISAVVKY